MSAAQEAFTGLSWIGKMEAKITFYVLLAISFLIALIFIASIISQIMAIRSKTATETEKHSAKEKLFNLVKTMVVMLLIFGIILTFAYLNMMETQKSKVYAATAGAADLIGDLNKLY